MKLLDFISKIAYLLPWRGAYFVLRGVSLVYYIFSRRKFLIIANLRLAFPNLAVKQIEKIARQNLFESALGFWEFLCLRYADREKLQKMVGIEADEEVWREVKTGRSIIVGVHMGSWEVINSFFASNVPYAIVAHRQKQSGFEDFIMAVRRQYGLRIIYDDDLKGLARVLRQDINLGLVFDHGTRGAKFYASFFGRQVPVPTGPLRLALRSGRKIIPAAVRRDKKGRQIVKLFTPIEVKAEDDFLSAADYLNHCFEDFIRAYPAGFLWAYKRFKRAKDVRIGVFSDGKAGHKHQAQALAGIIAELCPAKAEWKEISLNRIQKLLLDAVNLACCRPSSVCFAALKAVLGRKFDAVFCYGDVFVGCGSAAASLMRLVALFMQAKALQILKPNTAAKRYDLLIIPEHDNFPPAANVLRIKGALSFSSSRPASSGSRLRNYLWRQDLPFKAGIFIGGPLKKDDLRKSREECRKFIRNIKEFALSCPAGLLITTSRRTPLWLERMLKEEFYNFSHTLLLIIANEKNYTFAAEGIRELSAGLVVSADSVSMVTEAASCCDTFVVDLFSAAASAKHRKFLNSLSQEGYIKLVPAEDLRAELAAWHRKNRFFRRLENDKIVKERVKEILGR